MNPLFKLKAFTRPYRRAVKRLREGKFDIRDIGYSSALVFSQFGEDLFLASYFADQPAGFWVDVGAFHPILLSTTYLLHRKGWRGINVEPNPEGYAELVKHRPTDINLNCAISSTEHQVDFICDGVFSGIDDSTHLFHDRNPHAKRIRIDAKRLTDLLRVHVPTGKPIDFLSVDCEGHDLEAIRSNDWAAFRPRVVLVEDHSQRTDTELDCEMERHGYVYYCRLQLTKIFVEASEAARHLPRVRQTHD